MAVDLEHRARMLAHQGLDLADLCRGLDGLLRAHVEYHAAAWSTHDPATGLFTSCTLTGIGEDPAREARVFRHEFRPDEPASYPSLIAARCHVSVLSDVTEGDLSRAGRYRDVFCHFGVTDELRVILWADGTAWGSASLYRLDGTFDQRDVDCATRIAPHAAHGLRLVLLRAAAARPDAVDEPPGVLEARPDGAVVAMTRPADHWLRLGGAGLRTAANVTAAAIREQRSWQGATARFALPDGQLLSLHAATMTDSDGVAVIVDRARPAEVSAMMVDAYGLTPRQRDVLGLLLLGRSQVQIARHLGISEHTANDHRKAIYRRVGVSSRSELAALLQAEQYQPRMGGAEPSPYGGFLAR